MYDNVTHPIAHQPNKSPTRAPINPLWMTASRGPVDTSHQPTHHRPGGPAGLLRWHRGHQRSSRHTPTPGTSRARCRPSASGSATNTYVRRLTTRCDSGSSRRTTDRLPRAISRSTSSRPVRRASREGPPKVARASQRRDPPVQGQRREVDGHTGRSRQRHRQALTRTREPRPLRHRDRERGDTVMPAKRSQRRETRPT
jgi:hypothetical protein